NIAAAVIGVEIKTVHRRIIRSPINIPAADRAAAGLAGLMHINRHGERIIAFVLASLAVVLIRRLEAPPAVIAAGFAGWLSVYFLELVLSDIGNPHVAGLTVKTEPPGIAPAQTPNLRSKTFVVYKRVVRRHRI